MNIILHLILGQHLVLLMLKQIYGLEIQTVLTQHPIAIQIGNRYKKSAAEIWQHQLGILVIPRSNNVTHMQQNMDIFDFELNDDDMKQLYNITAPIYPQNLVYTNASNPQNLP
eukprot:105447_1